MIMLIIIIIIKVLIIMKIIMKIMIIMMIMAVMKITSITNISIIRVATIAMITNILLYWLLGLTFYHPAGCCGLLAESLCLPALSVYIILFLPVYDRWHHSHSMIHAPNVPC